MRFLAIPHVKSQNGNLSQVIITSLHILYNSLCTAHPAIRFGLRYTSCIGVCCIASRTCREVSWGSGKMLRNRRAVVLGRGFTSYMKMQRWCLFYLEQSHNLLVHTGTTEGNHRGESPQENTRYLFYVGICITNVAPPSLRGNSYPIWTSFTQLHQLKPTVTHPLYI
jgi:hypothetical protein